MNFYKKRREEISSSFKGGAAMKAVVVYFKQSEMFYGGKDIRSNVIASLEQQSLEVLTTSSLILVFSNNGETSADIHEKATVALLREGCHFLVEELEEI